ncbi:MAG: TonB-dependent siderophore receptor [Verrucomicrobiaceae bacterium]|nr:TonB-dependent siderophore receptor [Verrucomicrobiaceae bacterium]
MNSLPPFRPRRISFYVAAFSAALTIAAPLAIAADAQANKDKEETTLHTIKVSDTASASGELPAAYAGGQTARGARIGLLGNKDTMSTPFSITSYTVKAIEDKQAHTIADVVAGDPSIRVCRGFGNFAEAFVVRGFPLYGDDLGFNSVYGVLPRQHVATEMLERVEVFRGANAFLNGVASSNSGIGGNINLVPKRAQDTPTRQFTLSYEQGSVWGEHIDLGQRFGDQHEFGVRVNAVHRNGDTAVDDEELKHDFASIALDWIGEKARVAFDFGYQKHRIENGRPNVSVAADRFPGPPDASDNFSYPWVFSQTKDTFGSLRVDYDFTENLAAHASYGQRTTRENGVYLTQTITDANTGATSVSSSQIPHNEQFHTAEAGIDGHFQTGSISHQVNFSVTTLSADASNAYVFWLPFTSNLYNTPNRPQPTDVWFAGSSLEHPTKTRDSDLSSVAIADTLGFIDDKLLVTLGARKQKIEQNDYSYFTGELTAPYDDDKLSPSAGVVYKVRDNVSVYANYIEGLQQGATSNQVSGPPVSFAPYVSKQKEIGAKFDLGVLITTISIFETKQPSLINITGTTLLAGEQRNRGLEITWVGEPIKGTRILSGVTFYDAELTRTAGSLYNGNKAVGVPDKQGNLDVEWDASFLAHLTLRGGITYTDSQYLDPANNLEIPSWTTLDVGARYEFNIDDKKIIVRGALDNLTGSDYWSSTMGGYLVMGAPRTLSFSATVNF